MLEKEWKLFQWLISILRLNYFIMVGSMYWTKSCAWAIKAGNGEKFKNILVLKCEEVLALFILQTHFFFMGGVELKFRNQELQRYTMILGNITRSLMNGLSKNKLAIYRFQGIHMLVQW